MTTSHRRANVTLGHREMSGRALTAGEQLPLGRAARPWRADATQPVDRQERARRWRDAVSVA